MGSGRTTLPVSKRETQVVTECEVPLGVMPERSDPMPNADQEGPALQAHDIFVEAEAPRTVSCQLRKSQMSLAEREAKSVGPLKRPWCTF